MEGLSKTPDEIKKGLKHCMSMRCDLLGTCPYEYECKNVDLHALERDALAYIQQLERERDAAVADLRIARNCRTCESFNHEPSDQPCLSCSVGGKNYKWRGVKEDNQ